MSTIFPDHFDETNLIIIRLKEVQTAATGSPLAQKPENSSMEALTITLIILPADNNFYRLKIVTNY